MDAVYGGGIKIHRLFVLVPTLLCTAFLIAHGVTGIFTKILYLTGFIELNFPHLIVFDMQKLALWDLLFYEPWFLIMGIFAA
ncbi:DUF3995 domain-containing protein [Paenibacillus sp. WST5]|uniref:DUF3995 domain-containing protein n=1 Tax=Paenibacillus sedimenti TaxID=2770274 RepID=A0A926KVQ1_9BACL|nr:DUF3995 domain-containing protein [Paenibacillus sedimenti]